MFSNYYHVKVCNHKSYIATLLLLLLILKKYQINISKLPNTTRFSIFIHPFLLKFTVCLQTAISEDGNWQLRLTVTNK